MKYICSICNTNYDTMPECENCFRSHTVYAGQAKLTGGSSNYYKVDVRNPTSGGIPYTAECNDIIEALNMEYDVANAFKAAWRVAALRQGRGKPGQDSAVYDGEKIVFFGKRIIERAK